jgi:hypothetical protein
MSFAQACGVGKLGRRSKSIDLQRDRIYAPHTAVSVAPPKFANSQPASLIERSNEMPDRLSRLAPLTGVIFVGLLFATFATSGDTPGVHASGLKVISYYQAHHAKAMTSDFLGALGVAFGLFFFAALRAYLRRSERAAALAALGFGGGVVLAVGGASFSALDWGLADARNTLDPGAAQALNVLANDFFWPFAVGTAVFAIGNGLAVTRSGALPRWLGWVALVLGIAAMTPLSFFAFLGVLVWSLVVSILIFLRFDRPDSSPVVAAPPGAMGGQNA